MDPTGEIPTPLKPQEIPMSQASKDNDFSFVERPKNGHTQSESGVGRKLWHYNPKYCPFGCVFDYRIHQLFQDDFYFCEHTRNARNENERGVDEEGQLYRIQYFIGEPLPPKSKTSPLTSSSLVSTRRFLSQVVNLSDTVHQNTFDASRFGNFSPIINTWSNLSDHPIFSTISRFSSWETTHTSVFLGGHEVNWIQPCFIDNFIFGRDFVQTTSSRGQIPITYSAEQNTDQKVHETGETYASICRGSVPESSAKPAICSETVPTLLRRPMQQLSGGEIASTTGSNWQHSCFSLTSDAMQEKDFDHFPYPDKQQRHSGEAQINQSSNLFSSLPESSSKVFCAFCKNSGKPNDVVTSHAMKDKNGKNLCPYLRRVVCPLCHSQNEDTAHTMKYCPLYRDHMLDEAIRKNREK